MFSKNRSFESSCPKPANGSKPKDERCCLSGTTEREKLKELAGSDHVLFSKERKREDDEPEEPDCAEM